MVKSQRGDRLVVPVLGSDRQQRAVRQRCQQHHTVAAATRNNARLGPGAALADGQALDGRALVIVIPIGLGLLLILHQTDGAAGSKLAQEYWR